MVEKHPAPSTMPRERSTAIHLSRFECSGAGAFMYTELRISAILLCHGAHDGQNSQEKTGPQATCRLAVRRGGCPRSCLHIAGSFGVRHDGPLTPLELECPAYDSARIRRSGALHRDPRLCSQCCARHPIVHCRGSLSPSAAVSRPERSAGSRRGNATRKSRPWNGWRRRLR